MPIILKPEASLAADHIADIGLDGSVLHVSYPVRDDRIFHWSRGLWFNWNAKTRRRERVLDWRGGDAQDRAAQAANELLGLGIAVRVLDPDAQQRAIMGTFEFETEIWGFAQTGGEHLRLTWTPRTDIYHAAKTLPGAKYAGNGQGMRLPVSSAHALIEFCEQYDAGIASSLTNLAASLDAELAAGMIIKPRPKPARKPKAPPDTARFGEIDAELRDDD